MLLTATTLKKLDGLSLAARRSFTGSARGEKRSTKKGASVEYADFRAYNAGDDIRRIDWNAYARFDKLFLKMFLEEEDLEITFLVDCSLSMGFGTPSKLHCAAELAGALGYIGLKNYDRVSGAAFGAALHRFPPARGQQRLGQWFSFWESQSTQGSGDLASAAKTIALQSSRSGICIVISDFLYPPQANGQPGYEAGLKTLIARGFEITAIQILSREEREPSLVGDFKLVDCEDGTTREVSASAGLLRAYRKNLQEHTDGLRAFCLRYGVTFLPGTNDVPVESTVGRLLRTAGLVK